MYSKLKAVNAYGNHISSAELFLETLKNSRGANVTDVQQLASIVASLEKQVQAAKLGKQSGLRALGKKMLSESLREQRGEIGARRKIQEVTDMRSLVEQEVASFKKDWTLQKQLATTLTLQ